MADKPKLTPAQEAFKCLQEQGIFMGTTGALTMTNDQPLAVLNPLSTNQSPRGMIDFSSITLNGSTLLIERKGEDYQGHPFKLDLPPQQAAKAADTCHVSKSGKSR